MISLATVNMSPFHTDLGRYANVNALISKYFARQISPGSWATMFLVLRHGRYVRTQSNHYFRMNCVEKISYAKSAACPYFDRQPDQKPAQTAPFGGYGYSCFFQALP